MVDPIRRKGHETTVSTLHQGRKNEQRQYDYTYGKSDPRLRPKVTPLSDMKHLATLHKPTRTWLQQQGII